MTSALSFAGVNSSYLLVKSAKILSGLTNFSISAWIKTSSTPGSTGAPIYCERGTAGNDIMKLMIEGNGALTGKIGLTYRDDAGTLYQDRTSYATSIDGNLHHIVLVKSGTSITIYVDNTAYALTALTATNTFTNATIQSRIGGDAQDNTANFGGVIDNVKLYNTALSVGNVSDLYNHIPVSSGLIDSWLFDEGTGTTTADSVGSNTGTLSGTTLPTWVADIGEAVPTVTTQSVSSISRTTVTLNGTIVGTGDNTPTVRGFQYNTVQAADKDSSTIGSYGVGAFTASITGLTAGQTYFARAYATNGLGTSYGAWVSFTTTAPTYKITIAGVDRTADILNESLVIEDVLNDQQNNCHFSMVDRQSLGVPSTDQEIIITMNDGTILFGGYLVTIKKQPTQSSGVVRYDIDCVDYVRLFDSNLVAQSYIGMADSTIIADFLTSYCAGFGITGTNVVSGVTISQITFNYLQPSQCMRQICDLTGRNWYIDYSKDIHYFPLTQSAAPFNIDSSNSQYINLNLSQDASQLKNRVYVRGGTKLSDATTYQTKGDGVAKKFNLPDKPHNVSVSVNGASKTLGIKNIDLSGFDYYLNFEEKYIEQDSSGVTLTTSDTLSVTYAYDIPILVAVEDTSSIAVHGVKEFAIFDKSLTTSQSARDRASAELTDYANNLVEGTFRTFTTGFRSGQYININLSSYGVNANYIITKVVATSFGAGNYVYDISIASAKTMGIIRFLIELLEANKNLIQLSSEEVVDNLLSVTDSLSSDSLTDNLTIDSAGVYATWCPDSIVSTPTTRARWDLFQWW